MRLFSEKKSKKKQKFFCLLFLYSYRIKISKMGLKYVVLRNFYFEKRLEEKQKKMTA